MLLIAITAYLLGVLFIVECSGQTSKPYIIKGDTLWFIGYEAFDSIGYPDCDTSYYTVLATPFGCAEEFDAMYIYCYLTVGGSWYIWVNDDWVAIENKHVWLSKHK